MKYSPNAKNYFRQIKRSIYKKTHRIKCQIWFTSRMIILLEWVEKKNFNYHFSMFESLGVLFFKAKVYFIVLYSWIIFGIKKLSISPISLMLMLKGKYSSLNLHHYSQRTNLADNRLLKLKGKLIFLNFNFAFLWKFFIRFFYCYLLEVLILFFLIKTLIFGFTLLICE